MVRADDGRLTLAGRLARLLRRLVRVAGRPVWLYGVTQGTHVATGLAAIALLSAKLWSVYPRLSRGHPSAIWSTRSSARPVGQLVFLAALLIGHDGVLLPIALMVGALLGRWAPTWLRDRSTVDCSPVRSSRSWRCRS